MQYTPEITKALRWNSIAAIAAALIQGLQLWWVMQWIAPAAYGQMAIVLFLIRLLSTFTDTGLSQAIIREKDLSPLQLNSLYWFNVGVSILLGLVLVVLSPWLIHFYKGIIDINMILVACVVLLVSAFGAQYGALLTRNMDFEQLSKANIASSFAELLLALLLASNGWGLWALLWAFVLRTICNSFFLIYFGKKYHVPRFEWQWQSIKALFRFGVLEASSQCCSILFNNIDRLIIGKWLGAEVLGLYALAWDLSRVSVSKINPIINKVNYPLFAKLRHEAPEQLQSVYIKSVSILLLVNQPILITIAFCSEDLIQLCYGDAWAAAALPLRILAITTLATVIGNPGAAIFLSNGRPDFGIWWNLFLCVFTLISLNAMLYHWPQLQGAAWHQVILVCSVAWIWHYWVARIGGFDFWAIARRIVTTFGMSIPMCFGLLLCSMWHIEPTWLSLATKVIVGLGLYGLTLWIARSSLIV